MRTMFVFMCFTIEATLPLLEDDSIVIICVFLFFSNCLNVWCISEFILLLILHMNK